MKEYKIILKNCLECPKFSRCSLFNKESRFFMRIATNTVDFHPECKLADVDEKEGK